MTAVNTMDIRDNFNVFCDKVFDGETLIISRPKNKNVVMISENEYNLLQKAKRNADYLSMLDRSMEEAKSGNIIVKSLEDFD
ncbi:type II toxin-antitoxin system Phd/YefM family antitoxin [Treponema sp. OMZ 840]|uniref:type II toxin-antitoxin system Phd/YefM family antitoxin n=1 Tax=Treponema sp. OMZ 840 TaxID=244313 RepID=UPI003D9043CF